MAAEAGKVEIKILLFLVFMVSFVVLVRSVLDKRRKGLTVEYTRDARVVVLVCAWLCLLYMLLLKIDASLSSAFVTATVIFGANQLHDLIIAKR